MAGINQIIHRYQLPRCVIRGEVAVLTAELFLAGGSIPAVNVAQSSISIFAGGKTIIDADPITAPGSVPTYTLAAAATADEALSDRWIERWDIEFVGIDPGANNPITRPVYLVRNSVHPAITDVDLELLHSDLTDLSDPDAGNFINQRGDAWDILNKMLIQKGNRPQLVVDDWQLRDLHRYLTLEIIFRDFSQSVGDGRYRELANEYASKAAAEFGLLTLAYDFDEDGRADAGEIKAANPVTYLSVPWGWNS